MSPTPGESVQVRSLRKSFGPFRAVQDISFVVAEGEVLGFLGPNGAGKSTTMKMITGFLPVTSGEIFVCGQDIQLHPVVSRQQVGYLPEGSPLYGDMTAAALLDWVASIRGLTGAAKRRRLGEVTEVLELESVLLQRIDTLSKGYKRRVGLAQAILHDPSVLILDEPTDGLDPNQKHQVRELIRAMGRSKAIVISTHLLEEVDAVCDRAIVIDRGRLVFEGPPAILHTHSPSFNVVAVRVPAADAQRAETALRLIERVDSVERQAGPDPSATLVIRPREGAEVADSVGAALRGIGAQVLEMSIDKGRLDEVFRRLTSAAGSGR